MYVYIYIHTHIHTNICTCIRRRTAYNKIPGFQVFKDIFMYLYMEGTRTCQMLCQIC